MVVTIESKVTINGKFYAPVEVLTSHKLAHAYFPLCCYDNDNDNDNDNDVFIFLCHPIQGYWRKSRIHKF